MSPYDSDHDSDHDGDHDKGQQRAILHGTIQDTMQDTVHDGSSALPGSCGRFLWAKFLRRAENVNGSLPSDSQDKGQVEGQEETFLRRERCGHVR